MKAMNSGLQKDDQGLEALLQPEVPPGGLYQALLRRQLDSDSAPPPKEPVKHVTNEQYRRRMWQTVILLNTATFIQAISETLLPAVFKELGEALHASPAELGLVQTYRILVQAAFSLLAAYLVMRGINRPWVIGYGTALCSFTTAGAGLSFSYWFLVVCRAIDGIGLAVIVPAAQAMMADAFAEKDRGLAFGVMAVSYGFGRMSGSVFATLMAATTIWGVAGWRVAFIIMAVVGAVCGFAIVLFATDPTPGRADVLGGEDEENLPRPLLTPEVEVAKQSRLATFGDLLKDVWMVFRIDTFKAIILQGVLGSYPWQAMSFMTMWLELVGFDHTQSAILMAAFVVSIALGAAGGGWVGDVAARYMPDSGRVLCAQFSAFMLVPMFYWVLRVLPQDPHYFWEFFYSVLFFGVFVAWSATAANGPIFSEIVPAEVRTTVYAADRMFESLLAAFAPWGVGYIAEVVFGYDLAAKAKTAKDAKALGDALFWNIAITAALCALSYSWMYWTYPRDKRRVQELQSAQGRGENQAQ